MAGILSNGTYILKPPGDYDYVMYDADGKFAEGIKRADGNFGYGFSRIYVSAAASASFQIVPKYVTLSAQNDVAIYTSYMCSGNRFLERVEGHFNNVLSAQYMFAACSSLKSINDDFMNGMVNPIACNNMFSQCSSLSSWPANSFNSVTGSLGAIGFTNMSSMKNIDGFATSFENARGIGLASYFSSFSGVSSNLIPVIDHFRTKSLPLTSNSAHLFSACTGAGDYAECLASPIYSGWVV